jgi:hypothetical protein
MVSVMGLGAGLYGQCHGPGGWLVWSVSWAWGLACMVSVMGLGARGWFVWSVSWAWGLVVWSATQLRVDATPGILTN